MRNLKELFYGLAIVLALSGYLLCKDKAKPPDQKIINLLKQKGITEIAKSKDRLIPGLVTVIEGIKVDRKKLDEAAREQLRIQRRAILVLGAIGSPKSFAILDSLLNSNKYLIAEGPGLRVTFEGIDIHGAAILALADMAQAGKMREEALRSLHRYVGKKELGAHGVRNGAAAELGELGDKSSIASLRSIVSDETEFSTLRAEAAVALAQLGDERVLDYLIHLIDRYWANPEDRRNDFSIWGYHGLSHLAKINPQALERLRSDFRKYVPIMIWGPGGLPENYISIHYVVEGLFKAGADDPELFEEVILSAKDWGTLNLLFSALGQFGNGKTISLLDKVINDERFRQAWAGTGRYDTLKLEAVQAKEKINARVK